MGQLMETKLTNVRGVQWDMVTDWIFLASKRLHPISSPLTTKQVVLQDSFKLFDPLSIVSPVPVRAELLMQQLWQRYVAWGEPLDQDVLEDWTTILAVRKAWDEHYVICFNTIITQLLAKQVVSSSPVEMRERERGS